MKLYAASTTRNGPVYNNNYDALPATGYDAGSGWTYHIWYPVEIPEGLNSMFNPITTTQVDQVLNPWQFGESIYSDALTQERLLLVYNDSNQTIPTVKVSITDQQFTGGVMELTEWDSDSSNKIKFYEQFEILSTSPVNQFPENVYIKAEWSTGLGNSTTYPNEVTITNMAPYSWYPVALRLYIVKDQAVEEDYCVIATEVN